MKESESEDHSVECIGSMHSNLLSEPWYESDDRVTRQAASDRHSRVYTGFRYVPDVITHT